MNNVVLTSCRNESQYILEWVSWNIALGFDKVIIFTNDNTDNSLEILEKLKSAGYVEFFVLDPPADKSPQMYAFNKATQWLHEAKPNWCCCLDMDEFLFLKEDECLDDYLSRFPDADAIAINWKIFGSSDIEYKGQGLTIERFLLRANDGDIAHHQFKSLFKYRDDLIRFHHRALYKNNSEDELNYIFSDGTLMPFKARQPGFRKEDAYVDYSLAQINHYTIRSLEELRSKMKRGNGLDHNLQENHRVDSYRKKMDKGDIYENDILNKLPLYLNTLHRIKSEAKL